MAVWWCSVALSQPAQGRETNPATGLPAHQLGRLTPEDQERDPVTGLMKWELRALRPSGLVRAAATRTQADLSRLMLSRRYEEALQRCLAFHKRFKSEGVLHLLSSWVELGKKYPKAKTTLAEIRDDEVREFSEGRGYYALFQEVSVINRSLQHEDKTYELFNSLRDKDPGLAEQCYPLVEAMLVARGEYQWCYDHMGEPQDRFDSFRQDMARELARVQWMYHTTKLAGAHTNGFAAVGEPSRGVAERLAQSASTKARPSETERLAIVEKHARDNFVNQTRRLIEILVATDHQAEAETIRAQAVTNLDDARLKSAVTDARNHLRK